MSYSKRSIGLCALFSIGTLLWLLKLLPYASMRPHYTVDRTTDRYHINACISRTSLDPTLAPGWVDGNKWVSLDPQQPMHNFYQRLLDRDAASDDLL